MGIVEENDGYCDIYIYTYLYNSEREIIEEIRRERERD